MVRRRNEPKSDGERNKLAVDGVPETPDGNIGRADSRGESGFDDLYPRYIAEMALRVQLLFDQFSNSIARALREKVSNNSSVEIESVRLIPTQYFLNTQPRHDYQTPFPDGGLFRVVDRELGAALEQAYGFKVEFSNPSPDEEKGGSITSHIHVVQRDWRISNMLQAIEEEFESSLKLAGFIPQESGQAFRFVNSEASDSGMFVRLRTTVAQHVGRMDIFLPPATVDHYWQVLKTSQKRTIPEISRSSGRSLTAKFFAPVLKSILDIFEGRDTREEREQTEGLITRQSTDSENPESDFEQRWALIDEYARTHPGNPVSMYAKQLFPDLAGSLELGRLNQSFPSLPKRAPALWKNRVGRISPPVFIQNVYGKWMGENGPLTRGALRTLDIELYDAYAKHIARHPDSELPLAPTKKRSVSWVEGVLKGRGLAGDEPLEIGDVRRLLRAMEREKSKGKS